RAQVQAMIEQRRESFDDGETESDAARAVPLRIPNLIELLEHARKLLRRNAAAGVPHLHAKLCAAPAAHQNAAAIRVRNGIGDDVAKNALAEKRIAEHDGA